MPEGDTVFVAAERLRSALRGLPLSRTDFRVPSLASVDLAGHVVMDVRSRGKHLLFRTDVGTTIHTHFRMDGSWHLYRPGQRWRGPEHEVRAVLITERWVAVGFRLPVIDVIPTEEEPRLVGHLGPDVLGADWDEREAIRRLLLDADREVGEALIDQRVMAGPGNIYKSEACYLRGVDPRTPVGAVTDAAALVRMVKRLMEANRTLGRQVTTGDTRRGREHWVYGRAGEPCRRCGTPILRTVQGGTTEERVTFWCPSCQPEARDASSGIAG